MKPTPVQATCQPECKECTRFSILRTPCRPEACIFRQSTLHPAFQYDLRTLGPNARLLCPAG